MADYGVTDVEYCVVSGSGGRGSAAFFAEVQSRMRDGWECQGGVAATRRDRDDAANLFQAMVKETEMRVSEYRTKHGHGPRDGGRRKTRSKTRRNRNRSRRN